MNQEVKDRVEALRPVIAILIPAYLLFPLFYYFESFWWGLFFFVFASMVFLTAMIGLLDPFIRPVVQWDYDRRVE